MKKSISTKFLVIYFWVAMLIPNMILCITEPYSAWSKATLLVLPAGWYMVWSVAWRRSGISVWLSFPLIFCCALQIVLLYLFGNSVAATDMFLNIVTTNPGEATELLSNIYPSVIAVCVIYLPLLGYALQHLRNKETLESSFRRKVACAGTCAIAVGTLLLLPACKQGRQVVRNELFPVNVCYNMYLCGCEYYRIEHFDESSAGFSYHARREWTTPQREIYVFVIGEASRAASWQLYGYNRPTTPRLNSMADSLAVFRNLLTQSNTTHKSVPMILSSVNTYEHKELFRRKGLPALFKEAGFKTWFLSNQSRQGAMIDNLAKDADSVVYLPDPRYDMQLLDTMRRIVASSGPQEKLFFVLHCYGSHFSYHQRYPQEAAYFKPDDDVAIELKHKELICNAYDNTIHYTDDVLASIIEYLAEEHCVSALLYCADHGEDLMDDARHRFLHASPTTTCWQLHVASFAWFSAAYTEARPEHVAAAHANEYAPASSHALFQTIADIAGIEGDYIDRKASLASNSFDWSAPRYYLNDHCEAVPHAETGLREEDIAYFRAHHIAL
jgi:lipid A ethanolaminephosphotransferase